jgi:hypothetical protein
MKKILFVSFLLIGSMAQSQKAGLIHDEHAQLRKVGSFSAIKISNAIDLYLTQSDVNEVAVSASSDAYRDKIITQVEGGTLIIKIEDNDSWYNWKSWRNTNAKAYVSVKDFEALTASGATNIRLVNKVSSPKLKIKLSGASDFKGDIEVGSFNLQVSGASDFRSTLDAKSIVLNASGASNVELKGKADDIAVDVSGASSAKLYDLQAKGGVVNASGASTANVNASQLLKLEATGASSINYKGNAEVKENRNSGSSSIRHKN